MGGDFLRAEWINGKWQNKSVLPLPPLSFFYLPEHRRMICHSLFFVEPADTTQTRSPTHKKALHPPLRLQFAVSPTPSFQLLPILHTSGYLPGCLSNAAQRRLNTRSSAAVHAPRSNGSVFKLEHQQKWWRVSCSHPSSIFQGYWATKWRPKGPRERLTECVAWQFDWMNSKQEDAWDVAILALHQ